MRVTAPMTMVVEEEIAYVSRTVGNLRKTGQKWRDTRSAGSYEPTPTKIAPYF